MDVQKTPPAAGLFTRRFWANEIFGAGENRAAALFYSALSFLVALLFARAHAVFGAYPFAIAYLAAASRRVPLALLGACVGSLSLGERGYIYCAVCVAVFLLRLVVSHPRGEGKYLPACTAYFDEEPPLRAAVACVCGLMPAVYELLVGGLSFASVAFSVSMILLPTVSCVLYIWFFESGKPLLSCLLGEGTGPANHAATATPIKMVDRAAVSVERRAAWVLTISLSALTFTLVLSVRGLSWLGLSPAYCLAAFFCFLYARQWGLLRGGVAALFTAAGTLAPAYLPAFAALALVAGFFSRAGLFPMLVAATAAGEVVAFLFTGVTSVLEFLPEAVLCAILAWPFFKNLPAITAFGERREAKVQAAAQEAARRLLPPSARIEKLSSAYTAIGDVLAHLGEVAARPSESEYYAVCRRVFDRHCAACGGQGGCYENGEIHIKAALVSLAAQYSSGKPREEIRLPREASRTCVDHTAILAEIRVACAALEQERRRGEAHGILARSCRATADMLADVARQEARAWEEDPAAAAAVAAAFEEMGAPARHTAVFGRRRRLVVATGLRWDADHPEEGALCRRLEEVCACRFGAPLFEAAGGVVNLRLESARRYAVEARYATAAIKGEEVSGDAFSTFPAEDDRYFALLSDGMGSGKEAAITAGICGAYLRQMLGAGMAKATALRGLNTLLCERGKECSATVDLLEVDLYSGRACFLKSGAALSYVKRGESLFRIHAGTAPIGILPEPDGERVYFDLQAGDVVVMLSDGISGTPDDALWLCDMLCNGWEDETQDMADKILSAARRRSDQADDMTVALLEIREI